MTDAFRFPGDDEHMLIAGTNGTGKSQGGAWVLSKKDLANSRNVVIDYKGEELFNSLRRIREINVTELPKENGLYILRGVPFDDFQEKMRRWLYRVWSEGNTGLFVDEGYMIPHEKDGPFQALLTQGRTLRTPVITLTQRPVGINRFAISEANHKMIFDLNDARDIDVIREWTPKGFMDWLPQGIGVKDQHSDEILLPRFHSRWYDKRERSRFVLRPVPEASEIIDAIDGQLKPQQRWL